MTYRFVLISNEVEDFAREYKIDAGATFYDFHRIILSSCGYEDNQPASFFICNEKWEEEQEVMLADIGTSRADEDVYLMKDTKLEDLLDEEKQHLAYLFDPIGNRVFLIELVEITFGTPQPQPICSRQHGNAPLQTTSWEELEKENAKNTEELNEEFRENDGFDNEELDPEGFEISEGTPYA